MRSRFRILAALAAVVVLAGCSTVARVGGVLEATGAVVGKVGAVLSEGAVGDLKNGTDAVGLTGIPAEPAK